MLSTYIYVGRQKPTDLCTRCVTAGTHAVIKYIYQSLQANFYLYGSSKAVAVGDPRPAVT